MKGIKEGIPNALMLADYYVVILVIKLCLSMANNQTNTAASAYFTVYYSLMLHCTNYAIVETQGILGSKDIGAKNFKLNSLRFRQSVTSGLILFFF